MSTYFSNDEIKCPCGCETANVSEYLMQTMDWVRDQYGKPIRVNSACRCETHNKKVGGSKTSSHLSSGDDICKAMDIDMPMSSADRYRLIKLIMTEFGRVGLGNTFIHVDVDNNKPNHVLWLY